MIDSIQDLGITGAEEMNQIDDCLHDKLGISLADMTCLLQTCLQERAKEIADEFLVMMCYGDYGKILEDQSKMAHFLQHQASEPDNWKLMAIGESQDPKMPDMIEVVFANMAVDEGESVEGYVFLNYAGKVLHVFVQGNP